MTQHFHFQMTQDGAFEMTSATGLSFVQRHPVRWSDFICAAHDL